MVRRPSPETERGRWNAPGLCSRRQMPSLRGLVSGFLSGLGHDRISALQEEMSRTAVALPCVHGVARAWMTPSLCTECRVVIEASRLSAEVRAHEARVSVIRVELESLIEARRLGERAVVVLRRTADS